MSELLPDLSGLLRRLDYAAAAEITFEETLSWPAGELARLLDCGLLAPAEPARALVCEECGELHEVLLTASIAAPHVAARLRCSEAGAYPVSLERLQRWQITTTRLLDLVAPLMQVPSGRDELIKGRLWRLGRARWAGSPSCIYFGRALHRSDAAQIFEQARLPARSVVFVPGKVSAPDSRVERMPIVVALDSVLSMVEGRLQFDHDVVERQLDGEARRWPSRAKARPVSKRGSRMALVESLRKEMEEHLRTARDYALATLDRTGTPELLPRPTMEFLARRLRVNKSTVSRCFEDAAARELKVLWAVAADVDRLLRAGGHRS